ncbi:TonB-dependent receptor plug domain-containing protein [Achromobacter xylosoxidans]
MHVLFKPRALTLGVALALHAIPFVSVHAQTAQLQPISVEGQSVDDPRVPQVTTATRTQTPARYVPQAIDSVKVENVQNYGVSTLGEALSGIPNVSSAQDTRFDSLRIRGFDASNDFYLDGIRDDSQYVRDLHNIERIEVLKGLPPCCTVAAARAASSTASARRRSRAASPRWKRKAAAGTCAASTAT